MENINDFAALKNVCHALDLKFGYDIVVMDLRNLSPFTDYFVIATGKNVPQIQALSAAAEESLTKDGYVLRHIEGIRSANWVLLDFGDIIVHLFDNENRSYYNLERVWSDAKIISANPQEAS